MDVSQNMDTEPTNTEVLGIIPEAGTMIDPHVNEISMDERSIAKRKPSRVQVRPKDMKTHPQNQHRDLCH